MDRTEIRLAGDEDLHQIADLRWRCELEGGYVPTTGKPAYLASFEAWVRRHSTSHSCTVAVDGDRIIGMAWLAILPRVPTPSSPERFSGDVQSVFVLPEHRSAGVGGRMIAFLLERARERGIGRVTVHSSTRAIPAYARQGFEPSPQLLQTELK